MWLDLGQHFVFETLPVSLHCACICAEIPHSASSVCLAKLEHIIVRPRGHTVRRSISAGICSTWSFSSRTLIFDLIFRKKRSLRSHVGPPIVVHSNFGDFCYQPKRSDVFRQRLRVNLLPRSWCSRLQVVNIVQHLHTRCSALCALGAEIRVSMKTYTHVCTAPDAIFPL